MISALSTSVSGLQASMLRMDVSANDVANSTTPGYRQSDVNLVSTENGVAAASVRKTASGNLEDSNTNLAKEFGEEIITAKSSFSANLNVIKTQDEILGSLMDITA
ncbi:MAG TPA: flagellar basal body rod C-terminal domain-containing protein [Fibrobacteraceae bacterium]|nr:flagellar basal body rod C-terminal domain-containing protein [Fibrobacteraceae bacterium]